MESSSILGYTEEWSGASGNESGWTTYICSPVQETSNYSHHTGLDEDDDHSFLKWKNYKMGNYSNYNCDDTESDDSMTSDASSHPTRLEFPCKSNERNVIMCPFKHPRTEYSRRKVQKQIKQIDVVRPRIKVAKEVSNTLKANSATSHVNCGTKVRKAM